MHMIDGMRTYSHPMSQHLAYLRPAQARGPTNLPGDDIKHSREMMSQENRVHQAIVFLISIIESKHNRFRRQRTTIIERIKETIEGNSMIAMGRKIIHL